MFSVFVWSYETGRVKNLSGRVQREGHSPKCRVLRNFSFQPCSNSLVLIAVCLTICFPN